MKKGVLYTGTFDPFHIGHLGQLVWTYMAEPFDKAVIAMISANPKKPNASAWEDRKKLAQLMLASRQLPFKVEIQPIGYIEPEKIKQFVAKHLAGYEVTRTLASDSILEFIEDKRFSFGETLLMFKYAILIRALVSQERVEQAIASLPPQVLKKFRYSIIYTEQGADLSATNIRKDPVAAYKKGQLMQNQLEYIKRRHLYGS